MNCKYIDGSSLFVSCFLYHPELICAIMGNIDSATYILFFYFDKAYSEMLVSGERELLNGHHHSYLTILIKDAASEHSMPISLIKHLDAD
jgi:hypothetical protein